MIYRNFNLEPFWPLIWPSLSLHSTGQPAHVNQTSLKVTKITLKERGKTKERRVSSPRGYLARRCEERKRGEVRLSVSRKRGSGEREREKEKERHREREGEKDAENFLPLTHAYTRVWQDETTRSSISHGLVSKIIPNLLIWWFNSELRGIMVNKGWTHREIRKFMMFSSKLIKSDDESMVEIGENGRLWKITSNCFHGIKNHQNWSWFRGKIEDWSGEKFLSV